MDRRVDDYDENGIVGSKRKRNNNDDNENKYADSDDEIGLLMNQLVDDDGNDFINEEEMHRIEAEKRRMDRKKRYEKLNNSVILQSEQLESLDGNGVVVDKTAVTTREINRINNTRTNAAVASSDTNIATTINHSNNISEKSIIQNNDYKGTNHENSNIYDDDDDGYDMFSKSTSPMEIIARPSGSTAVNAVKTQQQQDWDDAEGYYKAVIGETIHLISESTSITPDVGSTNGNNNNQEDDVKNNASSSPSFSFRITSLIGKGVFSTVVKGMTIHNNTITELPPIVALKLIRHNETMSKAAFNELHILQKLKGSTGIVPLLLPTTNTNSTTSAASSSILEYRGHVTFVFPFMEYNLRDVLSKFGKGVGLSLQAVRSYFGQLLAAATHLQKHNIIHSDLKPDNILVSADFSIVQMADFGSAIEIESTSSYSNNNQQQLYQPTPYLVSRYYRAPEIILGVVPVTYAIDLWSLAVTVGELFLGDAVFRGKSNNDMLFVFQQHLGPFSNRMIRQHLVQCQKYNYNPSIVPTHFQQHNNTNDTSNSRNSSKSSHYYFIQHTIDPVTGTPIHKILSLVNNSTTTNTNNNKFPLATPIHNKLMKAKSAKDGRKLVFQFSDLLQKCLLLDPTRRIALKDALRHEFFTTTQSTSAAATPTTATTATTTTT